MALQGKGPAKGRWHRCHDANPSPPGPPPKSPRTVGDGGEDGLLRPLPAAAGRPHHVAAVAVRADDALPAVLPGQALQLLQGGHNKGLKMWGTVRRTPPPQSCPGPGTWFPRKRCWTVRVLWSHRATSPRLYPMRSLPASRGCSWMDSTGPKAFPHRYSSGTLRHGGKKREKTGSGRAGVGQIIWGAEPALTFVGSRPGRGFCPPAARGRAG